MVNWTKYKLVTQKIYKISAIDNKIKYMDDKIKLLKMKKWIMKFTFWSLIYAGQ